jgi:hypothetical protein
MNVPVTNPYEQAVAAIQQCFAALPVIVLGSGHSATFGLPVMCPHVCCQRMLQLGGCLMRPSSDCPWKRRYMRSA